MFKSLAVKRFEMAYSDDICVPLSWSAKQTAIDFGFVHEVAAKSYKCVLIYQETCLLLGICL